MTVETVIHRLTRRLFGSPIVRDDVRGELGEEIVALALEPDWELCSRDWAAFDLQHRATGARIQVRQSAARQSWHGELCPPAKTRYSIAEKSGRYEGAAWIAEPSRNADIFVFAWHSGTGSTADHRDARQWNFFAVRTRDLPATESISLKRLREICSQTSFDELGAKVEMLLR